jgi:hypothetical protein
MTFSLTTNWGGYGFCPLGGAMARRIKATQGRRSNECECRPPNLSTPYSLLSLSPSIQRERNMKLEFIFQNWLKISLKQPSFLTFQYPKWAVNVSVHSNYEINSGERFRWALETHIETWQQEGAFECPRRPLMGRHVRVLVLNMSGQGLEESIRRSVANGMRRFGKGAVWTGVVLNSN